MTVSLSEEVQPHRQPDHEIDPVFVNRWSPRAFAPTPVPDEVLWRAFEAARWAPSSMNEQPWRFVIARTPEDRARFVEFLMPANQAWARDAPVLIVVVTKKTFTRNGSPNPVAEFDAGCAWGHLAIGAADQGLITHGMAGFDRDKAREMLGIPDDFQPLAVIALGYRGDSSGLPEPLREREVPSPRRPITESVMEGRFRSGETG